MNRKKPYVYKRVIAYFIDLIIVTLLAGILTVILTDDSKYKKDSEELLALTEKVSKEEITNDEYLEMFDELNYQLTKDSTSVTIITIGVSLVYFVILSYFCHGITLGKYIMRIKIVSANDKELTLFNYLLRSLIVNMILSHATTVILISVLSKSDFIKYYSKVGNVFSILLLASFIFIMYREDGRGIEDFMGNTKVINIKDEKMEQVVDANVISERGEEK